jgi:hypothetical protein
MSITVGDWLGRYVAHRTGEGDGVREAIETLEAVMSWRSGVPFGDLVRRELEEARRGPYPALHSLHEAYAVLLEELDELWEMTRKKDRDRDPAAVLRELVQIAAMSQRAAEDLGFVRGEGS